MDPQRNPTIHLERIARLGRTVNPSKHTVRGLLGVLIALFACVTSGCLFPSGFDRRLFLQNGIELFGTPFQGQDSKPRSFRYRLLTIQYIDADVRHLNKLGIQSDNGDILPLGDIDTDMLIMHGMWYQISGVDEYNLEYRQVNPSEMNYRVGRYSVSVSNRMYRFIINDGHIIEFKTGSDPYFSSRSPSVLYSVPARKAYRFPLTQDEAIELFGEPYKIEDYKVYYPNGL